MKTVTLYYSSVPGSVKVWIKLDWLTLINSQIRKDTQRIEDILAARKVPYEKLDVTQEE